MSNPLKRSRHWKEHKARKKHEAELARARLKQAQAPSVRHSKFTAISDFMLKLKNARAEKHYQKKREGE